MNELDALRQEAETLKITIRVSYTRALLLKMHGLKKIAKPFKTLSYLRQSIIGVLNDDSLFINVYKF